ncbi:MAG: site-2 protease family protein, partial [Clostridia bacterium]|nr:site-2 protease family protein [Clostridia bacterium]
MEGEDEESDSDRSFGAKSAWKRMIIVAAGAFNNLVLGLILVGIMLGIAGSYSTATVENFYCPLGDVSFNGVVDGEDITLTTDYVNGKVEFNKSQLAYSDMNKDGKVDEADLTLIKDATADEKLNKPRSYVTGLRIGDKITKVNGRAVFNASDLSYMMMSSKDNSLEMTVIREGEKVNLPAVEFNMTEYEGKTYIQNDFAVATEKLTIKKPLSYVKYTFMESASIARTVWMSLFDLITGSFGLNDIMGPIGLVSTVSDTVSSAVSSSQPLIGLENVFYIMGLITINLGMMNLLPIPALDGGRLVFLLVECIVRRKLSTKVEAIINSVTFMLLMALILLVTGNDIIRIIRGG